MPFTSTPSHHEFIKFTMNVLLGPEDRRFVSWQDQLCRRNQELRRDGIVGFLYEGLFYKPSMSDLPLDTVKKPLHMSLFDEMDVLLRDKAQIEVDRAQIKQSLFALTYPCSQSSQEIRDALPECLVTILPDLRLLNRADPEAWTIRDNARAMRQYERVIPRIEMYVAARMIY